MPMPRPRPCFPQLLHEAERGLKISKRKDYYKILEISKEASTSEVTRAYRRLAKVHHPDKVDEADKEAATVHMHDITEAYEVRVCATSKYFDAAQSTNNVQVEGSCRPVGSFAGESGLTVVLMLWVRHTHRLMQGFLSCRCIALSFYSAY